MRTKRASRRGFSMIELVLVIAIMGILMGVVGWNMFGNVDKAATRATEASMRTLGQMIKSYNLEHSRSNPPTLQALIDAEYLDDTGGILDGWDSAYYYNPDGIAGREFGLISPGKDKDLGTEDDLDYWAVLAKKAS